MKCNYAYQLSKWQCHSLDKRPTVQFTIGTRRGGIEVLACCPVCANLLTEELKKQGEQYQIESLTKEGEDSAVPPRRS